MQQKNQDVGFSLTDNSPSTRWSRYSKSLRRIAAERRQKVLSVGTNAGKVSELSKKEKLDFIGSVGDPVPIVIGSTQKNAAVMKDCSTALTSAMGEGGGHIPMVIDSYNKNLKNENIIGSLRTNQRTSTSGNIIVAQRGREKGQEFEPRTDTTNSITSVSKDNYVARCLDANMHKGITPKGFFEKKQRNIIEVDVSKKIRQRTNEPNLIEIRDYLRFWRKKSGLTIKRIEKHFGNQAGHHWFEKNGSVPLIDDWIKLKKLMKFDDKFDKIMTEFKWTTEYELMKEHKNRHKKKGYGFGYQEKTINEQANTLTSTEKGLDYNLIRYNGLRRLTPIECERLQSFSDNFTAEGIMDREVVKISDTQRYKMMGNAVSVSVITAIIKEWFK